MAVVINWLLPMNFSTRLLQIRKSQGLTQQALASASDIHINQIRRYESGATQPTLEGLIKLAQALHVSLDELVFEENDRGPTEKLRLLFEATERLGEHEQEVIREVLEGLIIKYEAKRWTNAS